MAINTSSNPYNSGATSPIAAKNGVGGRLYNIINDSLGWFCFLVAAVTYLLTIEPTASFWDCPEFISQGAKLEVGHPPGNPIFMLTARFFVTIFGNDISNAAIAVNSMSALLSAATILLLFWTITHLVRKIMIRDGAEQISWRRTIIIMCAGLCGSLMYTWSDTFWFSAVEGEVYAFSSFCTALVFWLILKWENRADMPHSDRYLVLIAYVIGVSIAVHLLNLLCIPAIVLVFYYRKWKDVDAKGSLIALAVSVVIVAAILYGLVPGYIKVAQYFELFFVNVMHMGYNSGVIIYGLVLLAVFAGAIHAIYKGRNAVSIKVFTYLVLILSGLTFITDSVWVWLLLFAGFAIYLFGFCNPVPLRIFNVVVLSIFFIFVGYSSYALLLIRASANPPMNQNAPDNVFTLASYLNREQYGQRPLFYGPVFAETITREQDEDGVVYIRVDKNGVPVVRPLTMGEVLYYDEDGNVIVTEGTGYAKVAKTSPEQPDSYVEVTGSPDYKYSPDVCTLLTRIYSYDDSHIKGYKSWGIYNTPDIADFAMRVPKNLREEWAAVGWAPAYQVMPYLPNLRSMRVVEGTDAYNTPIWKPTFADNLRYFFNYQLNHMYWRYFMWNFAGRQNDIQGNGEPNLGNWISGIPFIDNPRLGDQSLVPDEYTKGNKGHNVFYMLPLLFGLLGILWQALMLHRRNPQRGIEQFWVIFFLFFMTGIAIVLYLNQTPGQPRERDYAFAGSFYAFAIWVGMGVPAISKIITDIAMMGKKKGNGKEELAPSDGVKYAATAIACLAGLFVPLQVVSQTWDDHDRSHRYTTRDFGANYLNSLEENAIIFTNGDNDTFPLWYSQEVEGLRPDVRVVNLSYLSTDWYANQMKHPYYDAAAVEMLAQPADYAYEKLSVSRVSPSADRTPTEAIDGLKRFYAAGNGMLETPVMYSKVDTLAAIKAFGIQPTTADSLLKLNYLADISMPALDGSFYLNKLLSFDIVANSVANGFKRPVYFATTVPASYYLGLQPYMYDTGVATQVTPFRNAPISPVADKAYENVVSKFRWGGLDDPRYNTGLYLDETVRRMVTTMRNSVITIAAEHVKLADLPASDFAVQWAKANGQPVPATHSDMARTLLNLVEEKLPAEAMRYESLTDLSLAEQYLMLYANSGNKDDLDRANALVDEALRRNAALVKYASSLSPARYASLGLSDRYALQYTPLVVGYKEFINLQDKIKGNPNIVQSDLDLIHSLLKMEDAIYTFQYALFEDGDAFQLDEEAAHYERLNRNDIAEVLRGAAAVRRVYDAVGIDPQQAAAQVLKPYGLTASDATKFSN